MHAIANVFNDISVFTQESLATPVIQFFVDIVENLVMLRNKSSVGNENDIR